jgi:CRISPR/Cas system-associated exonuclease Cas4 (RecB family)
MPQDKFSAVWVSHTSISDYLKCPRAYYLNNVYKDPATGHKVKLMSPALALGSAVHEVLESLSVLPTHDRFNEPLLKKFERTWTKLSGLKGGFYDEELERKYYLRGVAMLKRVTDNPGPVKNLAVKIKMDLPYYWLSEEDNIILCGKLDWLEYFPDQDAVHIIDFKTSKNSDEDPRSLQLPIYYLLATKCQHRRVIKASYWYLERGDELTAKDLPDSEESEKEILKIAKEIKLARKLSRFKCPNGEGGCQTCRPLEVIQNHEATFVGVNEFKQDIYILKDRSNANNEDSEIL